MRIDRFMQIRKIFGFTLSEALISLTIVGVVAALVVPIVLRDTMNKARITNLKSTVAQLNEAIQIEIEKTGATSLRDTNIIRETDAFFKRLDYAKVSSDEEDIYGEGFKYKNLQNGTEMAVPSMNEYAKLKNGVIVGIRVANSNNTYKYHTVYIDANGLKGPNVFGVDMFALYLVDQNYKRTDNSASQNEIIEHIGDLGCIASQVNNYYTTQNSSHCKASNTDAKRLTCYCRLERSGFDPNYMN